MGKKRLILRKENVALFILIIMVFSVFGMWKASQANTVEYNGFEFILTQNGWLTTINDKQYFFNFLPNELEQINSTPIDLNGPKVYIAYDSKDKGLEKTNTINYLGSIIFQKGIRVVLSCTDEENCPDDEWPIVKCDDASADVILLKANHEDNESKIFKQDKCYVIQAGNNFDLSLLREKFAYSLLKIIE